MLNGIVFIRRRFLSERKETLKNIFNYASLPLYGLGELLQKIDEKTDFPVFEMMGAAGPYMKGYFSGFFGAASRRR